MNTAFLLQLHENLKSLTLGNAARHLEEPLRQATERGSSSEVFLLEEGYVSFSKKEENCCSRSSRNGTSADRSS